MPVYAELVPLGGGDAIPLAADKMTVGRRRSNDICLDYPNVSSNHCEFQCEEGLWYVKHLKTSNGVKLNDEKLLENQRKVIKPGDTVVIARSHTYKFEYNLDAAAKAKLEEIAGQEQDDLFSMSLMEKAGIQKNRG